MKLRFTLVVVLVAMLAMMSGIASAQDDCLGLAEEDCAVIMAATANGLGDATSVTIAYDFELNAEIVEAAGTSAMMLSSEGTIDISEGMSMIPLNVGGQVSVAFAEDGAEPFPIPVEFRLVDDVVFFELMGSGWQGLNLMEIATDPTFTGALEDQISSIPFAGGLTGSEGGAMMDPEMMMGLMGLMQIPDLLTYERVENDFVLTLDLTALHALDDPAYEETNAAIKGIMEQASEGSSAMLPIAIASMESATLSLTQSVNTELNIVDAYAVDMDLSLDGAAFGSPGESVTVDMHLGVNLTNIGSAPAAEAPEEYTPIDPAMLLGLLGGM